MKIAVIGYSGAGKSTLAAQLGALHNCPVLHLDKIQFLPGWELRPRDEAKALVRAFMERPCWVIDGNYTAFYLPERVEDADQIVLLKFSRLRCFLQAWRRYRRCRNQVRPDMAEGCIEKFDAEFIRWLLFEGRGAQRRWQYRSIVQAYPGKAVVLTNPRRVRHFLQAQTGSNAQ